MLRLKSRVVPLWTWSHDGSEVIQNIISASFIAWQKLWSSLSVSWLKMSCYVFLCPHLQCCSVWFWPAMGKRLPNIENKNMYKQKIRAPQRIRLFPATLTIMPILPFWKLEPTLPSINHGATLIFCMALNLVANRRPLVPWPSRSKNFLSLAHCGSTQATSSSDKTGERQTPSAHRKPLDSNTENLSSLTWFSSHAFWGRKNLGSSVLSWNISTLHFTQEK